MLSGSNSERHGSIVYICACYCFRMWFWNHCYYIVLCFIWNRKWDTKMILKNFLIFWCCTSAFLCVIRLIAAILYQFLHNIFRVLIQRWNNDIELVGMGGNKKDSGAGTIANCFCFWRLAPGAAINSGAMARLGWVARVLLVFSAEVLIGTTPLGHPPNSLTWQFSQRSQLSSGFSLDAQDTAAFLEHFLLLWHEICSSAVGITRTMPHVSSTTVFSLFFNFAFTSIANFAWSFFLLCWCSFLVFSCNPVIFCNNCRIFVVASFDKGPVPAPLSVALVA